MLYARLQQKHTLPRISFTASTLAFLRLIYSKLHFFPSLSLLCALLATTCPRRACVPRAAARERETSRAGLFPVARRTYVISASAACFFESSSSSQAHKPPAILRRERSIATDYPQISKQMWKHSTPHSFPPLLTHSLKNITVAPDEEVGKVACLFSKLI
jgi:hypothetical protein